MVADVDGGLEEAQVGTFGTAALWERLYGGARGGDLLGDLLDGFGFRFQQFRLQAISPEGYVAWSMMTRLMIRCTEDSKDSICAPSDSK